VEKRECLPLGMLISLFLFYQAFYLMSKKTANRSLAARCEHLDLLENLPTQADPDVFLLRIP
jgi:hypothetical protein